MKLIQRRRQEYALGRFGLGGSGPHADQRADQYERFITNIFELNDSWREIWLHKHFCKQCRNEYTKIEKRKFGIRGREEFCSIECQKDYEVQDIPVDVTIYNTATVHMITHKPTGQR